jgi:hypothetical protein
MDEEMDAERCSRIEGQESRINRIVVWSSPRLKVTVCHQKMRARLTRLGLADELMRCGRIRQESG